MYTARVLALLGGVSAAYAAADVGICLTVCDIPNEVAGLLNRGISLLGVCSALKLIQPPACPSSVRPVTVTKIITQSAPTATAIVTTSLQGTITTVTATATQSATTTTVVSTVSLPESTTTITQPATTTTATVTTSLQGTTTTVTQPATTITDIITTSLQGTTTTVTQPATTITDIITTSLQGITTTVTATVTQPATTTTSIVTTSLQGATTTTTQPAATTTAIVITSLQGVTTTITRPASTITVVATTSLPGRTITTIKPTTVTSVTTVSATACPSSTACANAGLQYAVWYNPYGENGANSGSYPAFDAVYMKSTNATGGTGTYYLQYTGITTKIGIPSTSTDQISVYGGPAVTAANLAVSHRGYLYVQKSGVYTFDISAVNDVILVWVGPNALSGWRRTNANGAFGTRQNVTISTGPLAAGQYIPIRIVWANAQGTGVLALRILDPDGLVIMDGQTSLPGSVVQYSCDGTSAPAYKQAFGAET